MIEVPLCSWGSGVAAREKATRRVEVLSRALSLTHTHSHTLSLSFSLSHTHIHTHSLSLALSLSLAAREKASASTTRRVEILSGVPTRWTTRAPPPLNSRVLRDQIWGKLTRFQVS